LGKTDKKDIEVLGQCGLRRRSSIRRVAGQLRTNVVLYLRATCCNPNQTNHDVDNSNQQ